MDGMSAMLEVAGWDSPAHTRVGVAVSGQEATHNSLVFSAAPLSPPASAFFVLDLDVAAPGWTRPMQGPERSAVLHEKLPLSALEVGGLNRAEPAVCRLLSIPSELI